MANKGELWEEITAKYKLKLKLKRVPYMDLVAWPFADYVFSADWDVMSDVTKSRLYGFHDVVSRRGAQLADQCCVLAASDGPQLVF